MSPEARSSTRIARKCCVARAQKGNDCFNRRFRSTMPSASGMTSCEKQVERANPRLPERDVRPLPPKVGVTRRPGRNGLEMGLVRARREKCTSSLPRPFGRMSAGFQEPLKIDVVGDPLNHLQAASLDLDPHCRLRFDRLFMDVDRRVQCAGPRNRRNATCRRPRNASGTASAFAAFCHDRTNRRSGCGSRCDLTFSASATMAC